MGNVYYPPSPISQLFLLKFSAYLSHESLSKPQQFHHERGIVSDIGPQVSQDGEHMLSELREGGDGSHGGTRRGRHRRATLQQARRQVTVPAREELAVA
jgi:hypothetical protein